MTRAEFGKVASLCLFCLCAGAAVSGAITTAVMKSSQGRSIVYYSVTDGKLAAQIPFHGPMQIGPHYDRWTEAGKLLQMMRERAGETPNAPECRLASYMPHVGVQAGTSPRPPEIEVQRTSGLR